MYAVIFKLWPGVLRPSFGHFTLTSSSDRLEFDLRFSRSYKIIMIGNDKYKINLLVLLFWKAKFPVCKTVVSVFL